MKQNQEKIWYYAQNNVEGDTNLIPLLEEIQRLMHKCRSCQQVAELPRQSSHTLQMRKYNFSLQVASKLADRHVRDGGGNFVADCSFALTVKLRVDMIQASEIAMVLQYVQVWIIKALAKIRLCALQSEFLLCK